MQMYVYQTSHVVKMFVDTPINLRKRSRKRLHCMT